MSTRPRELANAFTAHYSNRARITMSSALGPSPGAATDAQPEKDDSDFSREARSTWACLLRKIFEADPLLRTCGTRMRIVWFIKDPRVIDRILRHRESKHCKAKDPFDSRVPPTAHPRFRQ